MFPNFQTNTLRLEMNTEMQFTNDLTRVKNTEIYKLFTKTSLKDNKSKDFVLEIYRKFFFNVEINLINDTITFLHLTSLEENVAMNIQRNEFFIIKN